MSLCCISLHSGVASLTLSWFTIAFSICLDAKVTIVPIFVVTIIIATIPIALSYKFGSDKLKITQATNYVIVKSKFKNYN